jgi:phage antirepressor YoqD-like protein
MNAVAQIGTLVELHDGEAFTTTLAIADGTDNQHKNVLAMTRTYQRDLAEFGRVAFETRPFETAGGTQHREVALLNEQQATLLLTYLRNNELIRRFKRRLVHAFFELAQRARQPVDLNNPAVLRRLLADYAGRVESLETTVAEQAPKAEVHDRLVESDSEFNLRAAGRQLGVPPNKFVALLEAQGFVFHEGGKVMPYAKHRDKGLFVVRTIEDTGGKFRPQTFVTGRGLAYFAARVTEQQGRVQFEARPE